MELPKREFIALEILKSKNITIEESFAMADKFMDESNFSEEKPPEKLPTVFSRSVKDLELSVRVENSLINMGIKTIEQLVRSNRRDLVTTPNIGNKSMKEIESTLKSNGLFLGMTAVDIDCYFNYKHNRD